MTIRIGIIGVGKMGLSHYAIANATEGAAVTAVADTSRYVLSVLRKYARVETYRSYEAMFAKAKLDGVMVATPTSMHFRCAMEAMERGLHVFVEKPLTLSCAESEALAKAAAARGLVNQVGFHNRFIGTFQEARRLVRSGALGEIRKVRGTACGPVVIKEESSTWRSKRTEGGGCLHDYACHVVDLMNFVVGPPARVVEAKMRAIHSSQVEDVVDATFEYQGGATGELQTNWSDDSVRKMTTVLRVEGTRGQLVSDRQELKVRLEPGAAFEDYPEAWSSRYITALQRPVKYYLRGEEYSAQLESFVAAIQARNAAPENSFSSAAQADRVLEEIQRASGPVQGRA